MKKCNVLRYYYYGHIFGCDIENRNFDDAVNYAFTVHKNQCQALGLVVDSRSKDLIINELKKLYDEKMACFEDFCKHDIIIY